MAGPAEADGERSGSTERMRNRYGDKMRNGYGDKIIDILYTLDSASNYSVIQKLKP